MDKKDIFKASFQNEINVPCSNCGGPIPIDLNEIVEDIKQRETDEKVIPLSNIKIIKDIQKQLPDVSDDVSINYLNKALKEAGERAVLYDLMQMHKEKDLLEKHGIQPRFCHNKMCPNCCGDSLECNDNMIKPCGCLYRMVSSPPNYLNYNEYMPSHKEALDMLEKHGLLKGDREEFLQANLKYNKAKSYEERDNTEIKGINMAQAREAIATSVDASFQFLVNEGELPKEIVDQFIDPQIIARNAAIEIEKAMGIYPNIK